MSLKELKSQLTESLAEIGTRLDQHGKMQIAINLQIALATVIRYTSGNEVEVRRLDLAEKIIAEGNKLITEKA